jgi:hypothetical protein
MTDPITTVARAAVKRLEPEAAPGLAAEVEAALAARQSPATPPQYADPVALAGLIVATAGLAWTVYTDLRQRTTRPTVEVIARTIRLTLRDSGQAAPPDHVIDVVVTETIHTAVEQGEGGLAEPD